MADFVAALDARDAMRDPVLAQAQRFVQKVHGAELAWLHVGELAARRHIDPLHFPAFCAEQGLPKTDEARKFFHLGFATRTAEDAFNERLMWTGSDREGVAVERLDGALAWLHAIVADLRKHGSDVLAEAEQ
ncbi:hypothetical protein D7I44_07645 [Gryllotalpicola protaetiae]|uniref:Uncharacterized protein n=2 Tax=Gryllotalpicola protaetiae TaxID=2419771 RepID=A0A387BQW4_9MICO|nr:hypothetical protein D7I44_07645 [Gryllotalpicola protaetiae]